MSRIVEMTGPTLIVNTSESFCSECGRSALPTDVTHSTVAGWDQHEGCGAQWVDLATNYTGIDEAVRRVRPDLRFIGTVIGQQREVAP